MPRINFADLENMIESENDYVDKREVVREKEAKTRFKDNKDGEQTKY